VHAALQVATGLLLRAARADRHEARPALLSAAYSVLAALLSARSREVPPLPAVRVSARGSARIERRPGAARGAG